MLQLWALDEPEEDDAPPAAARQVCAYQLPGVVIGAAPAAAGGGDTSDSGSDASAVSSRSADAKKKKRKKKGEKKERKGDASGKITTPSFVFSGARLHDAGVSLLGVVGPALYTLVAHGARARAGGAERGFVECATRAAPRCRGRG